MRVFIFLMLALAWMVLSQPEPVPVSASADPGPRFVFTDQSEPTPATSAPVEVPELTVPESLTMPPDSRVYRVRATGTNGYGQQASGECAAVAIEGQLLTVYHLTHDLRNPQVSVQVDGEWKPAKFVPVAGASVATLDMAYVQIADTLPDHASVRAPVYFEPVSIWANETGEWLTGIVSENRTVSLSPDCPGVKQGDSGSPIYGEDGKLIGIVAGMQGSSDTGTLQPRVVKMATVGRKSDTPKPRQANVSVPVQSGNCANGQCNQTQNYRQLFRRRR